MHRKNKSFAQNSKGERCPIPHSAISIVLHRSQVGSQPFRPGCLINEQRRRERGRERERNEERLALTVILNQTHRSNLTAPQQTSHRRPGRVELQAATRGRRRRSRIVEPPPPSLPPSTSNIVSLPRLASPTQHPGLRLRTPDD